MRVIVLGLAWSGLLFSAQVSDVMWPEKRSFQTYLQENNASYLLQAITAQERQQLNTIQAGEHYFELRDHGTLRQALIPLNDTKQIQLICRPGRPCRLDIIPIAYRHVKAEVSLTVGDGYDRQIDRLTHDPRLSYAVSRLFKGTVSFRTLLPTDRLAFIYTQKSRLGQPLGEPRITAAYLQTHG